MVRFRVPSFFAFLPLGCAWSLLVLGCGDNPRFPTPPDPASNLVLNGSFERPRVLGLEYLSYGAGDPITGWRIDGPVDQLSGPIWGPADGFQSLDLDGSCGT